MTKEDKELLLKDLCARLPYGVIIHRNDYFDPKYPRPNETLTIGNLAQYTKDIERWNIKPYLRPMSSMTEEEGVEWRELLATYPLCAEFNTDNRGWLIAHSDFILSHHFDIWNLIEKGFAIEAPEGMYK